MPELPEVETVRLQLLHKIEGKTIKAAKVLHPKSVAHEANFAARVTGKTITNIDRIGKLMIFEFVDEPDFFLLSHLKMTGQFFYRDDIEISGGGHSMTASDTKTLPGPHTRVYFTFTDGSKLFFNDMRLFGYIKTATAEEVLAAKSRFGQEPISDAFDTTSFIKKLSRRNTSIKAALLDQSFVAGLGNIYVDEALFAAKVRPDRVASTLSKIEARAVIAAGGKIMRHSITVGGTTFQHFVDTGGENGNYTDYLKVFGKQNTTCPRCKKAQIEKTRVAGRGTHFCPYCQK
jgi:formamidopyrimidine-DNA glycosylase